jgi:hypothetical protein
VLDKAEVDCVGVSLSNLKVKVEVDCVGVSLSSPDSCSVVVVEDDYIVIYTIKKTQALKKLMQDYCIRKGLEMNTICFLFDGNRFSETQPPAELSMEDDDMIEARYTRKLLAADAFAAALEAVPDDDWSRTWAADRTIMLKRTSKRVKEVVDKMRLPAVVLLSRSFWDDARNGTAAEKLEFVFKQLAALTDQCRISTLKLPRFEIKGQDVERLAGVLAQCPALSHLDLSQNYEFGACAESLAGVLAQCRELLHLNLSSTFIGSGGAESFAGVLGHCAALAHLDLSGNGIRDDGAERLGSPQSKF